MSMSNYLENALVNVTLRNIAYTAPTTVYLALYTTDPGETDAGTELSGNAYARQAVTFSAPSNGVSSNTADINFPVATGSWGTITHAGIRDAISGGNLLYSNALSAPQTIALNNQFIIKAGQLSVTLD